MMSLARKKSFSTGRLLAALGLLAILGAFGGFTSRQVILSERKQRPARIDLSMLNKFLATEGLHPGDLLVAEGVTETAPPVDARSTTNLGPQEQFARIEALKSLTSFYSAVNADDCPAAIALRPGYKEEDCKRIKRIALSPDKTDIKSIKGDVAVVYTEIAFEKYGDPPGRFAGHIALHRENNGWVILNNSYQSGGDDALPKYLEEFAPDQTPIDIDLVRAAAGNDGDPNPGKSFGSAPIFAACWNPDQLQAARRGEAEIRRLPAPDHSPPARTTPTNVLSKLPPPLANSIRSVKTKAGAKLIALSFDLCEDPTELAGYDAPIINYLRQNKVPATFFAGGKWMRNHPERTMQLMADPLFEIGNHSWTHGNLRVSTLEQIGKQVMWTQAQYELIWEQLAQKPCVTEAGAQEMEKIPRVPRLFRFPFGTCNSEALQFLADNGLPAIQWNIVAGDPAPQQTALGIEKAILNNLAPGAIIIMHANGRGHGTAAALPIIVPKIRNQGYAFVTISQILSYGSPQTVAECYENSPGDNLSYDQRYGAY